MTSDTMAPALGPIHAGEILLEEFLEPMGISQYRLARSTGVDPRRINELVHGKRCITVDTALRLGVFFGMDARFWLNLQARHDIELVRQHHGSKREAEVLPWKQSA